MNLPTCHCGQTYALNPSALMATPGHRTQPVNVLEPVVDVYGQTHGQAITTTSRWVQEGRAVQAHRDAQGVVTWPCVKCVRTVTHMTAVTFRLDCLHGAAEGGVCRVRENQVSPPSDLYVNPRHGSACPCCGHQGHHLVLASATSADMPACRR